MALPVAAVAGIVQGGLGVVQTISGLFGRGRRRRQMERLQAQRKAFQTPDEVFQQLNATQYNAQTGLGAETLNFMMGSADRAFSSSIGAATRLGGDPNSLSRIFDQRVMQGMQIGSLDQNARMANFGQYLNALGTVAQNRAAEQISRDNLLKDRIQALSAQGADDTRNIQSGLNSILAGGTAIAASTLYNNRGSVDLGANGVDVSGGSAIGGLSPNPQSLGGGLGSNIEDVPLTTDASQWVNDRYGNWG